jgi:protein SCO1/2
MSATLILGLSQAQLEQRIGPAGKAHPAVVTVVTPLGKISRYLDGIDIAPVDLRLALIDAAHGTIGTPVDQALLFCFHYDPASGRYGVAVATLLRLGGFATLAGLIVLVVVTRRRKPAVGPTRGRSGHLPMDLGRRSK